MLWLEVKWDMDHGSASWAFVTAKKASESGRGILPPARRWQVWAAQGWHWAVWAPFGRGPVKAAGVAGEAMSHTSLAGGRLSRHTRRPQGRPCCQPSLFERFNKEPGAALGWLNPGNTVASYQQPGKGEAGEQR